MQNFKMWKKYLKKFKKTTGCKIKCDTNKK